MKIELLEPRGYQRDLNILISPVDVSHMSAGLCQPGLPPEKSGLGSHRPDSPYRGRERSPHGCPCLPPPGRNYPERTRRIPSSLPISPNRNWEGIGYQILAEGDLLTIRSLPSQCS